MVEKTSLEELTPRNGHSNGYQVYSLPLGSQTSPEEEESFDLHQLWSAVRYRVRLIAAVTLGVTAAAALWVLNQEPQYKGQFQVLISSPAATGAQDSETSQLQQFLMGGSGDIDFKTKIAVLGSPEVLVPIVEQISQQYPELDYEDLVEGENPPLTIEQLDNTKILRVAYEDEDPQKVKYVLDEIAQGFLRFSVEERQAEIGQGAKFVEQQLPVLRQRVDQLQEKLQRFRQQHNLLDPQQQASELSTQLVELEEQYFETQVEQQETNSRYQILQGQLGLQPEQAITSSYLSESPRYQNLLNQLQETEVALAEQTVIFSNQSPNIEVLEEKRQNILSLLQQEAQSVLGSRFSEAVGNSRSLASPSELRLDLNQNFVEAANSLQVLELRRAALEQAINRMKGRIQQMPALARQYTDLQRELEVASENLVRFLKAEKSLELDAAQQALNWKVITPAKEPKAPISPDPAQALSLGLFGGLLLGVGMAFLAERFAPLLRSEKDLEQSIKSPILGRIPLHQPESSESVVRKGLPQLPIVSSNALNNLAKYVSSPPRSVSETSKFSPYLEAFRALNTNIVLLKEAKTKALVISSPAPAEGKTTVAVRLAQAAADMGQRVIIVDADLRRSQVDLHLNVDNSPGLSNVLTDGLDGEEVIRRVPQTENLFVLTAGEETHDPLRLLSSRRMQQLMERLQATYDLVIYDSPALLDFADSKVLATYAGGIVLVARIGKTNRSALKDAVHQLKISQVPVLGVVANGVE